jgi:hypothetical protein
VTDETAFDENEELPVVAALRSLSVFNADQAGAYREPVRILSALCLCWVRSLIMQDPVSGSMPHVSPTTLLWRLAERATTCSDPLRMRTFASGLKPYSGVDRGSATRALRLQPTK